MEKSLLLIMAFLLLTMSMLSGCFWAGDHESGPADYHDRDRGDHHEEHHDDHGDHR